MAANVDMQVPLVLEEVVSLLEPDLPQEGKFNSQLVKYLKEDISQKQKDSEDNGFFYNIFLGGKIQSSIQKIQTFILHLELFGDKRISVANSISKLIDLDLTEITRQKIIRKLKTSELTKLQRTVSVSAFNRFFENQNLFTNINELFFSFLQDLPEMSVEDIEIKLNMYRERGYLEEDPDLLDEILFRIKHEKDDRRIPIENLVLKIGKELKIIPETMQSGDLRKNIVIEFITKEGIAKAIAEIALKPLLQNQYFKKKLEEMQEAGKLQIELFLEDGKEIDAYRELFKFIEGKKIALDNDLAVILLPIVSRWKVDDCIVYCYEYLLEHRHELDISIFYKFILRYVEVNSMLEDLLLEDLKQAIVKRDYFSVDGLVELVKHYQLKIDLMQETKGIFEKQILRAVDIDILQQCEDTDNLYPIVEKLFCENVKIAIFKNLLEYAITFDKEQIISACVNFFKRHLNSDRGTETLAKIYSFWPPGKIPKCLVDELSQGCQKYESDRSLHFSSL